MLFQRLWRFFTFLDKLYIIVAIYNTIVGGIVGFTIVKGCILSLILATTLVALCFGNSPHNKLRFTFTWTPEEQRIVEGELRIEVEITIEGENSTVIIKVNDDDFLGSDAVAVGFSSQNRSGFYGSSESYAVSATDMTAPLCINKNSDGRWILGFALCSPWKAYQQIEFDDSGYTFILRFPDYKGKNPLGALKRAQYNHFVICFHEIFLGYVIGSRVLTVGAEADFYLP
jgi:hypothetical protein